MFRRKEEKTKNLDRDLRFITLGVGAYTGYCHAKGVVPDEKISEYALLFGPTMANGLVGGVKGAGKGFIAGSAGGTLVGIVRASMRSTLNLNEPEEGGGVQRAVQSTASGFVVGAATGTAIGAGVGGSLGIIHGGAVSLIGYWMGYSLGYLIW